MNSERIPVETSIVPQFREALADCKRLYIQAARTSLEDSADADNQVRRDMIRRMVDLHKGLLIKIYVAVARADTRWTPNEQALAAEMVDHIWQQRLGGNELRQVVRRMFEDDERLNWYSLVRPFDQVVRLRELSADLETIVLRVANLVAKCDGQVAAEESNALLAIQHEIQVHLQRISLDDDQGDADQAIRDGSQAVRVIHRESPELRAGDRSTTHPKSRRTPSPAQGATGEQAKEGEEGEEADSLEAALADLQQLVGLDRVKQEVKTLTNYLQLQQHRREVGLPAHSLSLHMVFRGNPGTGKTTVARFVGRIFKQLGLLSKGHLVETDRSGLVADYAGQTATKANKKIDEALDGVLFVDEAYSLVSSDGNDTYGEEAVQAIVKRMEDDRERLIVVLAGYPEPMTELLRSNPGLGSRFNTKMLFEDYTTTELGRIFDRLCCTNHYVLAPEVRAKLLGGFHWLYEHRDEHFGNGRLARNTFENAVRRLANRVATVTPVTRDLLTCFQPDDVHFDKVPAELWQAWKEQPPLFLVHCDHCEAEVHLRGAHLGKRVRCPRCEGKWIAEWGMPADS